MSQMDRRVFLAAAGASAAVSFPARAGAPAQGWSVRAPLPWAVQEIYCAVSGGRIVTAGGLRRPERVTEIEDRTGLYDPATDAWSEGPRLPQARHHPMLIAGADGTVFALGGYGRSEAGEWTGMTEVWALEADGWREAGRMPGPLSETVGVELGGRLHLVTGRSPGAVNGQWNDQVDVDTHRVFLPGEGRWETARPCPMARNSAAGAVLDGALWVAGGRTVSGGGTGRLDRYDPAVDRWDTLAPIPASPASGQQVGGGLAMAAAGGKLVAFGGEWFAPGGGGVFAETWIYDPAADRWAAGPPMRTPRHGLAAAAVDGVIYAIAGGEVVSGGRAGGVVEALTV
jgi:N-acetylneuraminic acid mutarotase